MPSNVWVHGWQFLLPKRWLSKNAFFEANMVFPNWWSYKGLQKIDTYINSFIIAEASLTICNVSKKRVWIYPQDLSFVSIFW